MAESVNNTIVVQAVSEADVESFVITRPGIAYDCIVLATNGGAGTVTMSIGGVNVTGALDPGSTDDRAVRTLSGGAWSSAGKVITAGETISFTRSAATLSYEAYCYIYPTPGFAG